jgi:hypothetical protein
LKFSIRGTPDGKNGNFLTLNTEKMDKGKPNLPLAFSSNSISAASFEDFLESFI